MRLTVYVLHGHWETTEERGATIVGTSLTESELVSKLSDIANRAKEYCSLHEAELEIEQSDTMFEMRDMQDGDFIGFYIVEQVLGVHDLVSELIYSKKKREYFFEDARNAIFRAFEDGYISREEYEKVRDNQVLYNAVIDVYEATKDCNVAFNDTIRVAVKEVVKRINQYIL